MRTQSSDQKLKQMIESKKTMVIEVLKEITESKPSK